MLKTNHVNWAVVGVSGFASGWIMPAVKEAQGGRLAAIVCRPEEEPEARKLANGFGVDKLYTDIKPALKDDSIDAFYLIVPTPMHAEFSVVVAEAGKHVLCEKPMAVTTEECMKMITAAETHGVLLAVGHCTRFHVVHNKVKELISSGKIGNPVSAQVRASFWYPPVDNAWRQGNYAAGGGPVYDMASHAIDLLRELFGEVRKVGAVVDHLVFDYRAEDSATILLVFANGVQATVQSCFNLSHTRHDSFEIHGTKGSIMAEGTLALNRGGRLRLATDDGVTEYDTGESLHYVRQLEHINACIVSGEAPRISGIEGLRNVRIIEAAFQSHHSGAFVSLV
ncbi:MAG: Gfo/Idh/MocA family oxidoreductase [Armatimonadetes bacterium]|nr:Gfo/Idh/MocA family oxidoreductase [Armatimonadota bacterium]